MITIQHLGYPMEWSDLENALKDPEGPYLEFKESPFLDNSKEIAAQLVSFANRYGGKIFVGVKDDGSIEGATIARDKRSLDILNVANNNCSPTVDVSFDYANSSSGDVLVISIDRRRGIPHAVIERKTGEIYNRLYYIRSGNGKRLVDDTMLRFLFEHKEDPGFSVTSSLCVWYDRKNLIFSPLESTDYFSDLLPFLQDLNTEDKNHLRSNEFENIQNLILQSFPYAFLHKISWMFSNSWSVNVEKGGGGIKEILPLSLNLPSDTINVSDIQFQSTPALQNVSINLEDILDQFMLPFKVPRDTKIAVHTKIENNVKESNLVLKNPLFSLKLHFVPSMCMVGLPSHVGSSILEDPLEIQNTFASCMFKLRLEASFEFPDVSDSLFEEHHRFAKKIQEVITDEWNWEKEIERLKDSRIYKINFNVMRTLSALEDIKRKIDSI